MHGMHIKACNEEIDERERKASLSPEALKEEEAEALKHLDIPDAGAKRKANHVQLEIQNKDGD